VLQQQEFERVGGVHTIKVDVRIITATNKDLEEEVREGDFRRDLFYRIAVVPIHLVPLRQRRDEIPLLVHHFIENYNKKLKLDVHGIEADTMRLLLEYPWPGNVRELENTIERAMVLAEGEKLTPADLPTHISSPVAALDNPDLPDDELSVKKHSTVLERRLIKQALERTGGNKTRAADLLELSSRALLYKIREYGLEE
jgi:two-component system response regulator AtoC